jgi:hypothetical protein
VPVIDDEFVSMSIERQRLNELFAVSPSLFDFYLRETLTDDEKRNVLTQIEGNEQLLLHVAHLFLRQENYSSLISFGLIVDAAERHFLRK